MFIDGIPDGGEELPADGFLQGDVIGISTQKLDIFLGSEGAGAMIQRPADICKPILFGNHRTVFGSLGTIFRRCTYAPFVERSIEAVIACLNGIGQLEPFLVRIRVIGKPCKGASLFQKTVCLGVSLLLRNPMKSGSRIDQIKVIFRQGNVFKLTLNNLKIRVFFEFIPAESAEVFSRLDGRQLAAGFKDR